MSRTLRRALLVITLGAAVVTAGASARTTAAPRLTGEPHVSGSIRVGSTLKVSNGAWANGPTSFAYQWYRCDNPGKTNCQPINGQTGNQYHLVTDDAGHTIYAGVTASNKDGSAAAQSDPVGPIRPNAAPRNTAAPTISGTPQVGQTLTAVEGSWTNVPSSFAYQWMRCDAGGNNCGAVAGATARTYGVSADDVNATLRVAVTARNSVGSSSATSSQTALVQTGTGGAAIPVATVSLPNQLVIADVKFSPSVLHSRGPFTARIKVTDGKNRPVAGALVYLLGVPYAYLRSAAEVATGNDGYATVTLSPTALLPAKSTIVLFVRVRKPGDPLVGPSVAARRLVQVTARF